ncbi:hypothetical protein B0J12DRAFT_45948 [Macrophomina phaseolina]|uniref:NAD-dependent epimerase/dehydratase domain-containing protein n=1 Tax=Macrophomina phaseolina TaxID=35725 RepID=A0ABQ8GDW3_9PEZI|nr:hypothetical protein B0J12DRAFT_45948 [Macrophomina phaseolina]
MGWIVQLKPSQEIRHGAKFQRTFFLFLLRPGKLTRAIIYDRKSLQAVCNKLSWLSGLSRVLPTYYLPASTPPHRPLKTLTKASQPRPRKRLLPKKEKERKKRQPNQPRQLLLPERKEEETTLIRSEKRGEGKMKVLLTGATGLIGSHTLHALLADASITTVYTLTRAPLSTSPFLSPATHLSSPKLVQLTTTDFSTYPPALLAQLRGVSACIWCIGGRHTQRSARRWESDAEYVRVSVEYTRACARALAEGVVPFAEGGRFRFVFLSGHATEWEEGRRLRVMGRTRVVKGMAEKMLFGMAEESAKEEGPVFEAYSVRPCGVYEKRPTVVGTLLTTFVLPSCRVEEVAAVLVEVAKRGVEVGEDRIVVHERIKEWGGRLLMEKGEGKK